MNYAKYNHYEEEMKKMLEQPYFARVKNKTRVKKGEVAFLPCRVKEMVNDYTVSKKCQIEILLTLSVQVTWMRLADVTILSVGSIQFTSDMRYDVRHIQR